jgi:hypothetical protein
MNTEERNALRAAVSLPLLEAKAEAERLQSARDQAEFEREWERRGAEFAPWIEAGDGFLSKMGRYAIARRQVRAEMQKPED